MGQAGTQYRELAFSIGCPIKTKGEQALNKSQQYAADGRRTPFPWLLRRHSKVAAVLSVIPKSERSLCDHCGHCKSLYSKPRLWGQYYRLGWCPKSLNHYTFLLCQVNSG